MGNIKITLEVFRVRENDPDLSEEKINQVIKNYDPDIHMAPIVIGHPQNDTEPAWGWVEKTFWKTVDGLKSMWIEAVIIPDFQKMLKMGIFRERSVGIFKAFKHPTAGTIPYLAHVAFLGAWPPAVKGMKPIPLSELRKSEKDEIIIRSMDIEEEESPKKNNGGKRMSEDLKYSQKQLEDLIAAAVSKEIAKVKDEFELKIKTFADENADLKKKLEETETEKSKIMKAAEEREVADFVEKLVVEKKIDPASKDQTLKILKAARSDADLYKTLINDYTKRKASVETGVNQDLNEKHEKADNQNEIDTLFNLSEPDYKRYKGLALHAADLKEMEVQK